MTHIVSADEIGAHVSSAGGVHNAPQRVAERGASILQMFTKMASRWAEPECSSEQAVTFRTACEENGVRFTASHDSYLINLATSDAVLFQRSCDSFLSELRRCAILGLDALVTHPGNATGGDADSALLRNADAVAQALDKVPGHTKVLFEVTAGSGTSLGATFRQIGALIQRVGPAWSHRMGVCFDTCHVWAAGYDLVGSYHDVFREFDDLIGLERIGLFHLNDSVGGLGSRRDRHAHIGAGALGHEPFRRIMTDERFRGVPKVIETPKDDDALIADLHNLATLRGYRSEGVPKAKSRANRSQSA